MAQTVSVNFKLDAEVKKAMEAVCKEMGLSMSAAFTIFAKKVGREHRIPFEISADPFYSEKNIAESPIHAPASIIFLLSSLLISSILSMPCLS